ncbi:FKBP-type peptidyl-prolyl cis-trans isomerase [Pacificimonas sp. WHA3]|uniref:Peptidyl-prolyl cis-trans isomerase n=1 Tax=Pacificimonas pallii TaxID=2827236 RepID=A0ABS6SCP8_9SPHN|nr:FKBP-type peptidyl-prolyl cis-trans isomerase [Pacificimonas pallii]MBV7256190.1 FKBP-type peptidyl-prolyl cis-trans isomerase [Pacificimonas pallii]
MAKRSTIADPMPRKQVRQQGVGFWLGLLVLAAVAMGLFSCVGTRHLALETTASGLQYQVLRKGEEGATAPGPNDTVLVHYEGTLDDGTVFDSSYVRGEPAVFGVGQVIPGWTEGLQLMTPGSKYRFLIPSELGYGQRGAGDAIPPGSDLIFEVELLAVAPGSVAGGPPPASADISGAAPEGQ